MPIFDQGYQHWNGRVSGHAWRWLAITRHGVRRQLSGRYVRLLMIAAWMPAVTLVSLLACWGLIEQHGLTQPSIFEPLLMLTRSSDMHACRHAVWTIAFFLFFWIETYFIMLIVTLAGPNLVSRDLRNNAFPLYFSRPLTRLDYFLGKLGVIAVLVAAVAVLPAVAAYVLGVCFSMDLSVLYDTWRLLPAILAYGLLIVVSAGTFMLALSSLSRRSLYVGVTWVGIWLIGLGVAKTLQVMHQKTVKDEAYAAAQAEEDELTRHLKRRAFDEARQRPPDAESNDSSWTSDTSDWEHSQLMDPARAERAAQHALSEAAKRDWRPLLCYNDDLERVGETLLDVDAAFGQIRRAVNESKRRAGGLFGKLSDESDPEIVWWLNGDYWVMQYPWTWSAGILAALMGISVCILSLRVKSLDRLK